MRRPMCSLRPTGLLLAGFQIAISSCAQRADELCHFIAHASAVENLSLPQSTFDGCEQKDDYHIVGEFKGLYARPP